MLTAPSSRRARRAFVSVRMRLVVAFCALVTVWSAALMFESQAAAADPIQVAGFSEENLPAQDMPRNMPNVAATPEAGPAADWALVPASSPAGSAPTAHTAAAPARAPSSPLPAETNAAQLEPTPIASPTDAAPLEVGSVAPQGQISDSSLQPIIQRIRASEPGLAASLRVTDQARDEILNQHLDDAMHILGRAISIDASNPYAYFYLGRAYMLKKNYDQAITFLKRAENRFGTNPQWLGETLAFEGLANEQSGQSPLAIACYQKALVAVPGNLMARVGLSRLGGDLSAPAIQPVAAPDPSQPGGAIGPPPNSPPPAPAN